MKSIVCSQIGLWFASGSAQNPKKRVTKNLGLIKYLFYRTDLLFKYKTRLPYLATPFLQAVVELDPQHHQFNKAHNAARSQIECVIDQLKARWKILKNGTQLNSVDQRSKLVQVLCALHNFILNRRVTWLFMTLNLTWNRMKPEQDEDFLPPEPEVDEIMPTN